MSIEKLLNDEIQEEFEQLKGMDLGSEDYKNTVDGLTKLMDRAIEMKKSDIDSDRQAKAQAIEHNLKLQQMKSERRDRIVKNCLTTAGLLLPAALTVWGTMKTFEFEEEGTVTTVIGRKFIQNLFQPKNKG